MTILFNNNAQTTLAGAISNVALTAALSPGSGALFPAPSGANSFFMTFVDAATGLINEIVKVTNVTGDVITMQRGQDGTTAKAWLAGDIAANFITAGALNVTVQASDLQSNKFLSATDTGTANSYIIAHTPAITALVDMMWLEFTVLNSNTAASTITIDANTTIPLLGATQAALQGGEMVAGGKAQIVYSASLGSAILIGCTGGATGRLINVQTFTASGTYTRTPGTTYAIIEAQGGGGGGGGVTVPSAGNVSLGAPGAGGSYGKGRFTAAAIGASQVVTIGAAGTVTSGAAGGIGGTTSVGALITAPGGPGGPVLNNSVPPQYNGNGTAAAAPTGANIYSSIGNSTSATSAPTAAAGFAGSGGQSEFGDGAIPPSINAPATAASNYGAGGSGCVAGSGGSAIAGGAGKAGIAIIYEYA